MNIEFDKYYETYKDLLEIVRTKYILGTNYSFKNGCRTYRYRDALDEDSAKRVYIMFCKYLFENKEYDKYAHLGESK